MSEVGQDTFSALRSLHSFHRNESMSDTRALASAKRMMRSSQFRQEAGRNAIFLAEELACAETQSCTCAASVEWVKTEEK